MGTIDYVKESTPEARPTNIQAPRDGDALVLDNGSSILRAGWSSQAEPGLELDNVTSKFRERRTNKLLCVTGADVYADSASRAGIKSPYEQDLVCNGEALELMLDSVFVKMGIHALDRPVVMSEPLNNALHSRGLASELLFEAYDAPSVAYGVDSLFSFYGAGHTSGMVVKSGTSSSHAVPVLDGQPLRRDAMRLAWGAVPASNYLLKLQQVKYPTFPVRLNALQASSIYKDHCMYATDFDKELGLLSNPATLAQSDVTIQFPYVPLEPKSEEELEKIAQRKRDAGRRLQEQANRKRTDKVAQLQNDLDKALELKAMQGTGRKSDFDKRLKAAGYATPLALDQAITKAQVNIQKLNERIAAFETGQPVPESAQGAAEPEAPKIPEEQLYPLLNVPDAQLSEDDIKEKRKQRLLKASADARLKARQEREEELARQRAEEKAEQDFRATDPTGWIASKRRLLDSVTSRIAERQRIRSQLQDRKSLVAQQRMRSIATLASEPGAASEGGSSGRRSRNAAAAGTEADDGFGKNDDDWAVYREITNPDDEEEEEDDEKLRDDLELLLLETDPSFTIEDTAERKEFRKHALFNAYYHGMPPDPNVPPFDMSDPQTAAQIHINVERIRVPEPLFSPTLAGVDQWGISDIVKHAFSTHIKHIDALSSCVYVTGGNTLLPNFDKRLHRDLRSALHSSAPLNIVRPADPFRLTDSWRGMAKWARDQGPSLSSLSITRAQYDEYGPDYIVENACGNAF